MVRRASARRTRIDACDHRIQYRRRGKAAWKWDGKRRAAAVSQRSVPFPLALACVSKRGDFVPGRGGRTVNPRPHPRVGVRGRNKDSHGWEALAFCSEPKSRPLNSRFPSNRTASQPPILESRFRTLTTVVAVNLDPIDVHSGPTRLVAGRIDGNPDVGHGTGWRCGVPARVVAVMQKWRSRPAVSMPATSENACRLTLARTTNCDSWG